MVKKEGDVFCLYKHLKCFMCMFVSKVSACLCRPVPYSEGSHSRQTPREGMLSVHLLRAPTTGARPLLLMMCLLSVVKWMCDKFTFDANKKCTFDFSMLVVFCGSVFSVIQPFTKSFK